MQEISYLKDLIVLLSGSIIMIIIFRQLKLSPVLGYLVSGAAIGPFGFGILQNGHTANSIAELGVIFLLFAIGLELTFDKLKSMRKYVIGFGGLQFIITASILNLICKYIFDLDNGVSLIIGSALALSSTAIVMQVIDESGDESSRVGRLSLSILIMQDLAVIPILVLLPLLSDPNISVKLALSGALFDAIIAMTAIFLIGRLLLRPIYRIIVSENSDVLFFSTTLLVILGSAFITHMMGMSFTLGAFIAGLMVAETEFKYRVESEITSIKSLLMGLFFMTVGMSFELSFLIDKFPLILILSASLIFIKAIVIIGLCFIFKFPLAPAIHAGLLLSQGGEFAFVVFLSAIEQNLMTKEISQLLITVVTLTMAVTPLLANIGRKIKRGIYVKEVLKDNKLKREIGDLSKHVIVIGFGKIGRITTHLLKRRGIRYVVLGDNNREVRIEKANGFNIYYGDPLNKEILEYIRINNAESVVIAMKDDFACMRITRFIHDNFPNVTVITKTETISNSERLKKIGATLVVTKNIETGLQLGRTALLSTGVNNKDIDHAIKEFRDFDAEAIKNSIYNENL